MIRNNVRELMRKKRHFRVRKTVFGTAVRPRVCIFRSLKHIQAQMIDDEKGKCLLTVSSLTPEIKSKIKGGGNIKAAIIVGDLLAQKAVALGIKKVVFDRAGYLYHGRVKSLADAARKGGLEF